MDIQKDNQIKDNLANAGEGTFSPQYMILKVEKLTSAIYLVTDFLSDSEPIKWKLRDTALSVLTGARAYFNSKLFIGQIVSDSLCSEVEKLTSFLQVAMTGSEVSEMNFSILKKEYEKLLARLRQLENRQSLEKRVDLLPTEVQTLAPVTNQNRFESPIVDRHTPTNHQPFMVSQTKGHPSVIKDKPLTTNEINLKKTSRRDTIINFIKGRGWTSITAIAQNFSDCSVKTIQRELSDLVHSGVLKKQGEKRWSLYSLIS